MVLERNPVSELDVVSVWDRLQADDAAQLIDVRTRAEWTFVGVADLSAIGKEPLLIEWQSYPGSQQDPAFAQTLDAQLTARGSHKTTNLYFICRSGARSLAAARAMANLGYSHCHNVTEGFEGPLSSPPDRHRGEIAGWKFAKLPWTQG